MQNALTISNLIVTTLFVLATILNLVLGTQGRYGRLVAPLFDRSLGIYLGTIGAFWFVLFLAIWIGTNT
jgi:hypothetical protein